MTTRVQDRLLGFQMFALLATFAGEALGVSPLVTAGTASFFAAVFALLVVMTVGLVDGVRRTTGPDMRRPSPDSVR